MDQRRHLLFEQGGDRLVAQENGGNDDQAAHEHVPLHGFHDKTPQHPVPSAMEKLRRHRTDIVVVLPDRLVAQIGQTPREIENAPCIY